jgi:hypothetical protein
MFLVLRTLFDVPRDPGSLPRMQVGTSRPPEPKDPRTEPRFPIVITDDIPWLAIFGYKLGGKAQLPEDHLAWFRKHGALTPVPLRPTDRPWETLDRLLAKHGSDPQLPSIFVNQLLALLDSVYRVERGRDGLPFAAGTTFDSGWRDLRARLAKLKIRWDQSSVRYVFADVSVLPEEPRHEYRRLLWPFTVGKKDGRLVVERYSVSSVHIEVRAPSQHLSVTAHRRSGPGLPLMSGSFWESGGRGQSESVETQLIELPEGESVRVEIESDGTHVTSPELSP